MSPEHSSAAPRGAPRALGFTAWLLAASAAAIACAGCRRDLFDQPRYDPYEESALFDDGTSARKPVEGTVARGDLREDTAFYTGLSPAGGFVTSVPLPLNRDQLLRGQERFNIYCSPCHSRVGDGVGMIVQRGFKQPSSFHVDRLRAQPVGYFVDVITNGFGQMPSYAAQVPPEARWLIAAYIKALQLSQYAPLASLPAEDADPIRRAETAGATEPAKGSSPDHP